MRDQLQYYPTGVRTAAKAWAKFRRPVRHLCDPSAGKGHLIRHAQEGFPGVPDDELPWVAEIEDTELQEGRFRTRLRDYARMKFSNLKEVSAIEINMQHHSSLKELGAKIIGYDFLQVSSLATVSNLIMNPPFQQGCAHVLHAWDVLYDAELVAIINAETIRNPFSQDRQRLCSLIECHGSVEFLQDEFTDEVERTTSVEIALIYLEKIPGQYLDVDALMGNLKRGDNRYSEIDVDTCNALALPGNFIQDTCFRFEQAVAAARRASEAIAISDHLGTVSLACSGLEHRHRCLVGMKHWMGQHLGAQCIYDRLQLNSAGADPLRDRGARHRIACTAEDRFLAVQGQVVGELGHQDMRQQAGGWNAFVDDMRGDWRLHQPLALPACPLAADVALHCEHAWGVVQLLCDVFANALHLTTALAHGRFGLV